MKLKSFKIKPNFLIILVILGAFLMCFLVCSHPTSDQEEGFKSVKGSWTKSCTDANIKNDFMTATCQSNNGMVKTPSIDVAQCEWKVKNDNGVLQCE
jgi:hypothetical protein